MGLRIFPLQLDRLGGSDYVRLLPTEEDLPSGQSRCGRIAPLLREQVEDQSGENRECHHKRHATCHDQDYRQQKLEACFLAFLVRPSIGFPDPGFGVEFAYLAPVRR